ncbi:MAG: hypothetical protein ABW220_03465, partial [Burkholderiaceae bacterium]
LDAAGAVVASDVAIDADGRYENVTLTGAAPWRIEACGHAGPNYLCVYSVAGAAGTANVTPLTTATVLLAANQAPDALMSGTAPALTANSVEAAQTQLRNSLSSVLSGAGVSGAFDFVSGALAAGSRTAYDAVLDAVGVNVGPDAQPFVQITPRLGSGNLYLEQGTSTGTVTAAAGASSIDLSGLETLFRDMSTAIGSAGACTAPATGLRRSLAANAQMSIDGPTPIAGAANVEQALCGFFADFDGGGPMWGARFLSPTLGRCDLSGAAPVCAVSFVLGLPDGGVMPVGNGMGVTQEAGVWKFQGDLLPISINADARAQRTRRVDGGESFLDYNRAFAFDIAAVPGLACARVAQRNAAGTVVPMAFFKLHPGATDQHRLALWTTDGFGNSPSVNPLVGTTRSGDDTWVAVPDGSTGDDVIRNFYRGGRSVTISLYSDANCSVAHAIGGKSEYEVDVDGVPPLWAEMENLPWPELTAATRTALGALSLGSNADGTLDVGWAYARGPLGVNGVSVCGDRATCGQGGAGRLGERDVRASVVSAAIELHNGGPALEPASSKMVSIHGRNGEGVSMQSNYTSCPATPSGQRCN